MVTVVFLRYQCIHWSDICLKHILIFDLGGDATRWNLENIGKVFCLKTRKYRNPNSILFKQPVNIGIQIVFCLKIRLFLKIDIFIKKFQQIDFGSCLDKTHHQYSVALCAIFIFRCILQINWTRCVNFYVLVLFDYVKWNGYYVLICSKMLQKESMLGP